jgi:AraC-like DNA-binding protein
MPAGELGGLVVDLHEVWGSGVDDLVERLAATPRWRARLALLERFLLGRLRETRGVAPEVAHAWDRLIWSGGRVSITDLADEVGWSRRHLSSCFGTELGLAPKQAGRVLRFERASALLLRGRHSLAEVSFYGGFADQAHLHREWRALAGATPGQWLRQERHDPPADTEFPFVQDVRHLVGASSQA